MQLISKINYPTDTKFYLLRQFIATKVPLCILSLMCYLLPLLDDLQCEVNMQANKFI